MLWKYIVGFIFHKVVFLVFGFQHFQSASALHFELSQGNNTFENLTRNASCVLADVNTINTNGNLPQNISGNAWIAPHTAWINFIGCFEGTVLAKEAGWRMSDYTNLHLQRCFLRCNLSEFVFTREHCFCKDQVILNRTDGNCSVDSCPNDDHAFCPGNNEHACLCEYKPINTLSVDGKGDCMIAIISKNNVSFPKFKAENCSVKHLIICKDKHNNVKYTGDSKEWKEAMKGCQHSKKPVIYDKKIPKIHFYDIYDSVYWVAAFRKTVFSRGEHLCLSVKIENGEARPEERNCTDRLPALCNPRSSDSDSAQKDYTLSNISDTSNENTESNNLTSTTSTTFARKSEDLLINNESDITTGEENLISVPSNSDNESELMFKVIIGSCPLVIIVLILVVVLTTYHLKKTEKVVSETDIAMNPLYNQNGQHISQCKNTKGLYNEIDIIKPTDNMPGPSSTDFNTKANVENVYSHLRVGRRVRESKVGNDTYDTMANIIANSDCAYAILINVTKSDAAATNEIGDIKDCDTRDLNDYDTVANIGYGKCKDCAAPIKEKHSELHTASEIDLQDESVHLTLDKVSRI